MARPTEEAPASFYKDGTNWVIGGETFTPAQLTALASLNVDDATIDVAAVWGGVTGTLSDQTDLQAALDAKLDDTGVKVYRALLTQSGTDAPVATVLENSLGGDVVWTYVAPGKYRATLAAAFPEASTFVMPTLAIAPLAADGGMIGWQWNDADSVDIRVIGLDGGGYNGSPFNVEILVYP